MTELKQKLYFTTFASFPNKPNFKMSKLKIFLYCFLCCSILSITSCTKSDIKADNETEQESKVQFDDYLKIDFESNRDIDSTENIYFLLSGVAGTTVSNIHYCTFLLNNSTTTEEEPLFKAADLINYKLTATSSELINSITIGCGGTVNSNIKFRIKITGINSNIVFLDKEVTFVPNITNHFEQKIFVEK